MGTQRCPDRIIIGIDFGTTYSGVAWAYSESPKDIDIVTSWEAELNHCSDLEKAPTKLCYESDSQNPAWGYGIPQDHELKCLKWFKLLLLDKKDVPAEVAGSTQYKEAERLRQKLNKGPTEVVSAFLKSIWNHAIESIGRSIGEKLLAVCQFHVVITLPAIWPPYAQQRMRAAATLSGMLATRSAGQTVLRFISEPEAAALATLKDVSKFSTIKQGNTMVVCDAGGGTVDLITYEIVSIKPFAVRGCVKGTGGLHGAVFLDDEFLRLMERKVTPGAWADAKKSDVTKFLHDNWEHGIKPQFENQEKKWLVELPEGCQAAPEGRNGRRLKRSRTMELTSAEILSAFDPIVEKIESLVKGQADAVFEMSKKGPTYFVLVGGFGRSRYLYKRIQKLAIPYESTVLQSRGSKPWSAICRGAVVQGLTYCNLSEVSIAVTARVARFSYGIKSRDPFKPSKHLSRDKVWSEEENMWRAKDQMTWFLKQGENMTDHKPVKHNYHRLFKDKACKNIENEIFVCDLPLAPRRKDSSVKRLCKVKWNREISMEDLPTWTNDLGAVSRKLSFDIEMTCEEGTLEFVVWHDGKRVAGHNVEVTFD